MSRKITPTHVLLNQIELSSSASSVTFSNIPQGYGDLVVIHNNFGTANNDANSNFIFNDDTSSSYDRLYAFFESSNSTPVSGYGTGTNMAVFGLRTTVGLCTAHIMDYSATDKHKTVLTRTNTGNHLVWMSSGRWTKTEAINSIKLSAYLGNFAVGSVISLYGVYA